MSSKKLLTVGVVAVVLIGAYFAYGHFTAGGDAASQSAAAGAPGTMPISVAVVAQKDITEWSEFSGRLRAAQDVQIRPRVSGTIDSVHFKEGDVVKKGDKLFTIDLRPYQAAFSQADAALAAAKARSVLASSEAQRSKKLLDGKAVSQQEYDQKNNASLSADADVKAAKATLELAQLNLEYAEVRAPISGRVGRADITVGNNVEAGASGPAMTTMQSIDPIYADFDIDEQAYLRITKAARSGGDSKATDMPVYMALADEGDFKRQGRIRSFDNQLATDSGTMRVRAEFDNPDGLLTPGLFARIRLGGADKTTAVLINDGAIGTDQDRKFVYVVDDKGAVNYRPVTIGDLNDGLRIVTSGLQAGEKIIVNGLQRVHPGMNVQPIIVDMTTLKGADDKAAPAPAAAAAPDAPKADAAAPAAAEEKKDDTAKAPDAATPATDAVKPDAAAQPDAAKPEDTTPDAPKTDNGNPADYNSLGSKPADDKSSELAPADKPADAPAASSDAPSADTNADAPKADTPATDAPKKDDQPAQ